MPALPRGLTTSNHHGVLGRIRSRSLGRPRPGTPAVVLVQGLAVADYLLPTLTAVGRWTRAHLVELPGFGGSGDPPHELSVPEFGRALAGWLTAREMGPVILAGHSSGTQVVAEAAVGRTDVAGLVLAGPTLDPAARGWLSLLVRRRMDGHREPEWRTAGTRRTVHLLHAQLRHEIEEPLLRLTVPVLVLRGDRDRMSTPEWGRWLAAIGPRGRYLEVPGAHDFPWIDPDAWSGPIRDFTAGLATRPGSVGCRAWPGRRWAR